MAQCAFSLGNQVSFGNLHFSIDLSVDFEGLKRSNDNVIVISTYHKDDILLLVNNIKHFSNLQPSSLRRVWPSEWSWLGREPRRPSCWPHHRWWVAQCWQRPASSHWRWWCRPCRNQWFQRLPWTPESAFDWRVRRCLNQTSLPSLILFRAWKEIV